MFSKTFTAYQPMQLDRQAVERNGVCAEGV